MPSPNVSHLTSSLFHRPEFILNLKSVSIYAFIPTFIVEETEYSDYNVAEENSMRESVERAINEINSLNDDMKKTLAPKRPQVLFYFDLRLTKDV
jgi:hypothetical protein